LGSTGEEQGCGAGVELLVRSQRAEIEMSAWKILVERREPGQRPVPTLARRSGTCRLDRSSSIPRRSWQRGGSKEDRGDGLLLGSFKRDVDQRGVFIEMRRRRCC
jgi:hypothetical protein